MFATGRSHEVLPSKWPTIHDSTRKEEEQQGDDNDDVKRFPASNENHATTADEKNNGFQEEDDNSDRQSQAFKETQIITGEEDQSGFKHDVFLLVQLKSYVKCMLESLVISKTLATSRFNSTLSLSSTTPFTMGSFLIRSLRLMPTSLRSSGLGTTSS
jgi:hypothetical protein